MPCRYLRCLSPAAQDTCGLTIMRNQCDVFASSRQVAFYAIPPRLLVSKGISHCHFLLRQIHHLKYFHLKYIPYIIFDTFSSSYKEGTLWLKKNEPDHHFGKRPCSLHEMYRYQYARNVWETFYMVNSYNVAQTVNCCYHDYCLMYQAVFCLKTCQVVFYLKIMHLFMYFICIYESCVVGT